MTLCAQILNDQLQKCSPVLKRGGGVGKEGKYTNLGTHIRNLRKNVFRDFPIHLHQYEPAIFMKQIWCQLSATASC